MRRCWRGHGNGAHGDVPWTRFTFTHARVRQRSFSPFPNDLAHHGLAVGAFETLLSTALATFFVAVTTDLLWELAWILSVLLRLVYLCRKTTITRRSKLYGFRLGWFLEFGCGCRSGLLLERVE